MTTRPNQDPGASPGEPETVAAAIVAASAAVLTILALDIAGPVRVIVVFGYLLVVPGLAITRAAGFSGSVAIFSLAVALSVGVDGTIGMALYAARRFEPVLATILVVAVALTMVFIERASAARRPLVPLEPPDVPPSGAPTHR